MPINEEINLRLREDVSEKLKSLGSTFQNVSRTIGKSLIYSTNKSHQLNAAVRTTNDRFVQLYPVILKNGGAMTRFTAKLRMATQGMRGFRMEMLSVMFFGMQISMTFGNMMRPASETLGIFELWQETLRLLLLPVMIELLPKLISFMTWIMNLSQGTKMFIGNLVLLAFVIGKILFLWGMIALGIGGLFEAGGIAGAVALFNKPFIALWGWLVKIGGFIKILGKGFSATALLIISTIIGIALSFKDNFNNIRGWADLLVEGIKNIFGGIKKIFDGLIDVIVGVISGDGDQIKEGFSEIVDGILDLFLGLGQSIISAIVIIGTGVIRPFKNVLDWIKDKFIEALKTDFGNWALAIVILFKTAVEGAKSWWDWLKAKIKGEDVVAPTMESIGKRVFDSLEDNDLYTAYKKARGLGEFAGQAEKARNFITSPITTSPTGNNLGDVQGASRYGSITINQQFSAKGLTREDSRAIASQSTEELRKELKRIGEKS